MKHILLNLKSFFRNQRIFFTLMVCAILTSSFMLLFAFGAYQNYQYEKKEFKDRHTYIIFDFYRKNEDRTIDYFGVTQSEVQQIIESLDEDIHDNVYNIAVPFQIPEWIGLGWGEELFARFIYRDGVYQPQEGHLQNLKEQGRIMSGRYYTYEEYATGANVMQVTRSSSSVYPQDENGNFIINGAAITPILTLVNGSEDIPFLTVPDDTVARDVAFLFYIPPNSYQVDQLMNAFSSALGDRVVLPEWEPFYTEDYMLYDTMIGIAVLIAVVAALNIIVLYYYILLKRRKFLAITMLCGCTRIKAVLLYLGESLALTVPLFAVASACYHFLLLPLLSKLFPFIDTAYSFKLYAVAMLIYIAVCTVGMLLVAIRAVYGSSIAQIKTTT